jgi:hypothetical protein
MANKEASMPRHLDSESKLLQIPVKKSIADRIGEFGSRLTKSQAQFALICLEVAFEDREGFSERLGKRLVRALGSVMPKTRAFRKQVAEDDQIVRMQVPVPADLIVKLEQLGSEMNHTPVQAAGWMLERIVTDEEWIVRAVLNPLLVEATRWVKGLLKNKEAAPEIATAEKRSDGTAKRRGPRSAGNG